MYHIGFILEETDPEKSLFYYKQAAECGSTHAQVKYAHLLLKQGETEEAARYFKQAAERGDQQSNVSLGFMLESDKPEESLKYFKIASDNGNAQATEKLAKKSSTENDPEKTYLMMNKLIESGNFMVPLEYAVNLYNSKQYKQAFHYFSAISKANHPIALYFIAVMKFKGLYCEENREEAFKIMKKLSENGIDRASEFIEDNFNSII